MAHQRVAHHVLNLSIKRYLLFSVLGNFLIDVFVIYGATPFLWHEGAPPAMQFIVWEIFWVGIGFSLLYASRAGKMKNSRLQISVKRLVIVGIIGGFAIDFAVIFMVSPFVWHDPAPAASQFLTWEAFWISIGLGLLMLSRTSKKRSLPLSR